MRPFKSVRRNLRGNIFAAFSVLLFLSFALVGGAFNFAVSQYIRTSSHRMLEEARSEHYQILWPPYHETMPELVLRTHRSFFSTNMRRFVMDEDYSPLNPHMVSEAAQNISVVLRQNNTDLRRIQNLHLRTTDQQFFITAAQGPGPWGEGPSRYTIFYLDVTDLQQFAANVNIMLLALVVLIWLLAMGIATFLAGSLARPLHSLSGFARRIGQGDYTPHPVTFDNEEFEKLNETLNHTALQLAKYDNDQKTFFQNVSHELRTPLMSIRSYAEGIKHKVMEPDEASQIILSETARLTEIVGDILYVSRIDSIETPAMEAADLVSLAEARTRQYQALAAQRGITLTLQTDGGPIVIACVIPYIQRALDNLISNALRYAATKVEVECYALGAKAQLRVIDDGPGFSPDDLSHVFDRFFKGQRGLTGIGLSIVKSVVDQHHGIVMAENGENGAILTISLPRRV